MAKIIFLDRRRQMKERIQAAKRLAKSRQNRIDRILRYAEEHCNWDNEEKSDS